MAGLYYCMPLFLVGLICPNFIYGFEDTKLYGVSHVAVTVEDLRQANLFYVNILGGRKVDKLSTPGVFGDALYYSMFQNDIQEATAAGASLADYGICDIKDFGSQEVAWDFILFDAFLIQLIQCQIRNTDIPVNFHRPNYVATGSPGTYSHMAFWYNATTNPEQIIGDTLNSEKNFGLLAGFQTAGPPPATEAERLSLSVDSFVVPFGPGTNIASTRGPSGEKIEVSLRDPAATADELTPWCKEKAINKEMLSPAYLRGEGSPIPTQKVVGLHHVEHTVEDRNTAYVFYTEVIGAKHEGGGPFESASYNLLFQDDEFEAKADNIPNTVDDQARFGILKNWNDQNIAAHIDFYLMDNLQIETYNFRGLDATGESNVNLAKPTKQYLSPGFVRTFVTGFWLFEEEDFDAYSGDLELRAMLNAMPEVRLNRANGGTGGPSSQPMTQFDLEGYNFVYFKGPSGQNHALVQFKGRAKEALKEAMISYGAISTAFDEVNPFKTGANNAYCCNLNVNVTNDGTYQYCQSTPVPGQGCATNPCVNGGFCVEGTNSYTCLCVFGYTGVNCEQRLNTAACQPNPCMNGGMCNDFGTSYTCTCQNGFTGQYCEIANNANPCDTRPCLNNGLCVPTGTNFTCQCQQGFSGNMCEQQGSPCNPSPCLNFGMCTEYNGQAYCSCPYGYSGQRCELVSYNPCYPNNPCYNGGFCTPNTFGSYQCQCVGGFYGVNCEFSSYQPPPWWLRYWDEDSGSGAGPAIPELPDVVDGRRPEQAGENVPQQPAIPNLP